MPTNPPHASAPRFRVEKQTVEGATIVKCSGRLTLEVAGVLRAEVKSLIPQSAQIVLDLSELASMDSAGLGALVGLYVSARRAGCEFRLIHLSKHVRELLGMTNLLSAFEVLGKYPTKMP